MQDLPGPWGQPTDPSQWSSYYGYGQGYDAYSYGATQDPSLYGYGAYAGYLQYPQQAINLIFVFHEYFDLLTVLLSASTFTSLDQWYSCPLVEDILVP